MKLREQQPEQRQEEPRQDGEGSDGSALDAVRDQAERLVAAGEAAIARALSRDSEAFLRDNRQHGGE